MVDSSKPRVVLGHSSCLHSEVAEDVPCSCRVRDKVYAYTADVCYACGKVFLSEEEQVKYDNWMSIQSLAQLVFPS